MAKKHIILLCSNNNIIKKKIFSYYTWEKILKRPSIHYLYGCMYVCMYVCIYVYIYCVQGKDPLVAAFYCSPPTKLRARDALSSPQVGGSSAGGGEMQIPEMRKALGDPPSASYAFTSRRHGILTLKAVGVDERFSVDKRLPVDGRCI